MEGPTQVVLGEATVYTVTLYNRGPHPATGVVLTDVLAHGLTALWAQPAQPVCQRRQRNAECDVGNLQGGNTATVVLDLSVAGTGVVISGTQLAGVSADLSVPACAISQDPAQPKVTCRLTRLQPGAEAQVHMGISVDAPFAHPLTHTATIEANEADPDPSNNSTAFTMTVEPVGTTSEAKALEHVTRVPPTADLVVEADGPSSIVASQPFTYTYTIMNRGTQVASEVRLEDALPSDLALVTYAPGLPRCHQRGDALTCSLHDLENGENVTFTLVITGHAGQPLRMDLDPLLPGWPICYVVKERTWLHIVHCELGNLEPRQAIRVHLVLTAIGVQERTTANTVSVNAREADSNPADNTITSTIAVQAQVDP
jgi:uncharacterized repeat protein (TIGR01451 family)